MKYCYVIVLQNKGYANTFVFSSCKRANEAFDHACKKLGFKETDKSYYLRQAFSEGEHTGSVTLMKKIINQFGI